MREAPLNVGMMIDIELGSIVDSADCRQYYERSDRKRASADAVIDQLNELPG